MRIAACVKGFRYFLPLDLTMSTLMIYELVEWAAEIFGGDLGVAYLAPGDVCRRVQHKDMLLPSY